MPPFAASLEDVEVAFPGVTALRAVTLGVRRDRCTVVIGPGGSGKSTLLRVIAGRGAVPGAVRSAGAVVVSDGPIAFHEQRGRSGSDGALASRSVGRDDIERCWRGVSDEAGSWLLRGLSGESPSSRALAGLVAFTRVAATPAAIWLFDEPDVGANERTLPWITLKLGELRGRGTVVLVTHNQGLAARVADDAVMLVDGALVERGPAKLLFRSPRRERTREFLCLPRPGRGALPTGFRWLLPGRLAGSGRPGLLRPIDEDMAGVRDQGVSLIVTLTEEPLDPPATSFGLAGAHVPVPDMGIPSPRAMDEGCRVALATMDAGGAVLAHCRAGKGRTGVFAACCMIARGDSPEAALQRLRAIHPMYVQTPAQERFLHHYAAFRASERARLADAGASL